MAIYDSTKYILVLHSIESLQPSIHFPDVGDCISPNHLSNVHHIDCMIIFTTVTYTLARHLQIHIRDHQVAKSTNDQKTGQE